MATVQATQVDQATYDSYDKLWVLRALWDPVEYQRYRDRQLTVANKAVAQWPDSPLYRRRVQWIQTHTPEGPVIPPSEPTGLTLITYHCIEILKDTLANYTLLNESERISIDALLHAYRSGSLAPQPGLVTYWYNGIQTENPGPPGSQRTEVIERWEKEHGKGSLWIETVRSLTDANPQMAALSIYPRQPQNNFNPLTDEIMAHHNIHILVRIVGFQNVQLITVLDDTGSSYLELFMDDCLSLGLDPSNIPASLNCGIERLTTANGIIRVRKILVEVQYIASDNSTIGLPIMIKAVIRDGYSENRPRCSGQSLRRHLFTATAPGAIGAGNLHVGTR
ncbi:hypothetical protein DTO195F2_2983 [Paecilomyces variotii]|nr:hypothetical protein DTO195F2_2983 [Paecilomyces variotii]KAJ9351258.1 hypothetical protein DTO027B9_6491 [Paecilomyces variotii]